MLVSSIARFDALNNMNNAAFASMQLSNNMMKFAHNRTFEGDSDLSALNKIDKRASISQATNGLLYKLAYYQEQMLRDMQADEIKKYKINFVA